MTKQQKALFETQREDFEEIIDHGFRPEEILEDHYVLGGLGDEEIPREVINTERDHIKFLPSFEDIQNQNSFESMNCTVYGTENGIQILEKEKYGIDKDYDERTVGIGAGTTQNGGSPHNVCEWIRNNGMTSGILKFTSDINTWKEYYSPKPLTQDILDEAEKWLEDRYFRHRWLFKGGTLKSKQDILWDALLLCAPGVSVTAWKMRGGLYYKEVGEPDNHWCTLVAAKYGEYWVILDHYDKLLKKLEWDYDFGFAKQYYLKKKTMNTQELLQQNNNKLLMDSKGSGDIGVVVGDKLLIAPADKPERLAHIIATYLLRNGHGIGVEHDIWEAIPKEEI